ncbi:hypothetical protein MMC24_001970 [Lignoscripta atroalba]|nr:hypothetical protein [Lignoscripta atroalba]
MANQFVPLIILIVLSCIGAFVGYAIYTVANDVADKTQKKMEQKNVMFSKDGMRVGVKELKTEDYVEQTQRDSLGTKDGALDTRGVAAFSGVGVPEERGRIFTGFSLQSCLLTVVQIYSMLVKAWNYSTWPAYKSRLWNKDQSQQAQPRQRHSTSASSSAAR